MEAPFVDCGAAPGDEAGDGADAFLEDVVDEIRGCVAAPEGGGDASEEPDSASDVGAEEASSRRVEPGRPPRAGPPPASGPAQASGPRPDPPGGNDGARVAEDTRRQAPRVDPPEKGAALR